MLLTSTTPGHPTTSALVPRRHRVLVLCTGNSARSILTEALFNSVGVDHFDAQSAGSRPTGAVHPLARELIGTLGIDPTRYTSKGWQRFLDEGDAPFDFVITVCDHAAETCPVFPGEPVAIRWSLPDPAAPAADDAAREAFAACFAVLRRRVERLAALAARTDDRDEIAQRLIAVAQEIPPHQEART